MKIYTSKSIIVFISVIVNTIIFIILSILHFYWAFGGELLYNDVLPTSSNGLHKMNPGTTAGLIVGLVLLFLALITLGNQGWFDRYIKRSYFRYSSLIIAIIFIARAIGDFKFIGFFKTVKGTRFGMNDTHIFSPLCLFIALISVLIFLFTRNTK